MPESHIDVSSVALCFCTRRWFTSMPCVREAVRAVLRKVPLIALLDAEMLEESSFRKLEPSGNKI